MAVMATAQPKPQLLERDMAIERCDALTADIESGRGGVVLVQATAGGGKTALLDLAAERALVSGCVALQAAGDPLETDLAFGVLRQLFSATLHSLGPEQRAELMGGPAGLASAALGLELPSEPSADPIAAALHGVYWLCLDLASLHGPQLLVLDDAHATDAPSLRVLNFLARRLQGTPVGMLIAGRPTDGSSASLLEAVAPHADPESTLTLDPLSTVAAAELIRRHRPDADDETCRACHEAAAGNPFLLTELATGLRDRHVDHDRGLLSSLDLEEVGSRIARRLERLGERARRVVEVVALFPGGAELRHVAELTETSENEAGELAETLAQSLILGHDRPLAFRHPLLREAVLSGLSAGRQAHDHGRIADLLAAEGAPADEVSAHLVAAEPAARPDRIPILLEAAHQAAAAGAPDLAVRLLNRALAEPPPRERRLEVEQRLGLASLALGDASSANTLLGVLERTEDPAARVQQVFPLAHAMAMAGRFAEIVPILEQEAERFEAIDEDLALRLRAEAFWIAWQDENLHAQAQRLLETLGTERRAETLAQQIALCYRAHMALVRLHPLAEVAALAAAGALDTKLPERGLEAGAPMSYAVTALGVCDRLDDARAVLARAEHGFRVRGEIVGIPMVQAQLAWVELLAGDLAAAEAAARVASAALDTQPQEHLGRPWVQAMTAQSLLERGDLTAALDAVGGDEPGTASAFSVTLLATRGEIRAGIGDLDGALADLRQAVAWCERKGLGEPVAEEICRRRELAMVLWRSGEEAEALATIDSVLADARSVGAARLVGESLRVHGLVVGGAKGLAELESAVELLAGSVGRLAEAKARIDLGAALRRANRRTAAREPLRSGMELARQCGAEGLRERAEVELRATGARPRRVELSGPASLTPSEQRVAELAAAGRTNREIAQELFVTLRTVEMHLSNAFRKLEISGRRELPTALSTEG